MPEKRVNCPYCVRVAGKSPDTRGHLYINEEKKVFHCKRCGHSGKHDFQGSSTPPTYRPPKTNFDKIELFSFKFKNVGSEVYDYACSRLPFNIVLKHTMWSPDMPGHLFFPVFEDDKMVSWQARSIDDSKPKYLSWGPVSEYVYNTISRDNRRGERGRRIKKWAVINEGPINALSCPHGVALFGKNLSHTQFLILTHSYDTIYIALDYGAEKEIEEIAERLNPYVAVKIITFKDKRDANDLGWTVMEQKIRDAKPYEG